MGDDLVEKLVTCVSLVSLALSLIIMSIFKLFGFNAKKELTKLKIMKLSADVSQVSDEQMESVKVDNNEIQKDLKRMSKSCATFK